MDIIEYYLSNYESYIVLSIICFLFLLLIITFVQSIKLRGLRKKYLQFMKPGEQDIEKLLINQINQLEVTEGQIKNLNEKYFKLDKKLENAFQKVGLVRYNAFNDLGGNLSFAIALLNSKNDGFLINGIHGREGSYTYVKTIENGQPSAQVSNEEKEALKQAINR